MQSPKQKESNLAEFVDTPIYDEMAKEFPEAIEVLNRVKKDEVKSYESIVKLDDITKKEDANG